LTGHNNNDRNSNDSCQQQHNHCGIHLVANTPAKWTGHWQLRPQKKSGEIQQVYGRLAENPG
ncbi:hypothetical protein, partial [Marinobacter sp.]|uniref:hypothetical protein n=1 Tax=Marinobacter sp. TaxID=50741 RepID=UPI0032984995